MPCLDTEQLEQFAAGDAANHDALRRHLENCPECKAKLHDVQENLDAIGPVREALSSIDDDAAPERVGPYRIIREIGRGGMGVVYEAEQERPRRHVALKLIRSMNPTREVRRRFEREAQVLGRLQHSGIAQVFEAGVGDTPHGPCPYFAMELIRGEPLPKFCAKHALGLEQKLELLAKICDAAHHAHVNGVIHRDLKPANILVDATGQPKILDFGVARAVESNQLLTTLQTGTAQLIGTVPYMSPEQSTGDARAIDARSDVYALGVVAYEVLAGRLPFAFDQCLLPEALRIIQEDTATPLSSHHPELRGDLDTIVAHALSKEKHLRYASADEFAADIRRYLRDEPIEARPPSAAYQLRKFARRNRALIIASSAVFAAVFVGAIIAGWQAVRATRAERAARGLLVDAQSARQSAEQSATQARAESEKYRAVNTFLQEMLGAADPDKSPGKRDLTVREALERAINQIDQGTLSDQPEIEVAVRTTVGNVYRSLGDYPRAGEQLVQAVDLARGLWTDGSEQLAFSLNKLARLTQEQAAYDEAEILFREALAMRRRLLGDSHPDVAVIMNNLGWLMQEQGRYDDAEKLHLQSLELQRRAYGNNHSKVATSLNNLAILFCVKGQSADAVPLLRESLSIDRKLRGPKHPNIATTMANLSVTLGQVGKIDEAIELAEQSIALRRELVGAEHPTLATELANYGKLLLSRGNLEQAESKYREALAMDLKLRGSRHPNVANTMTKLALLLDERAQHAEAETLLEQALAIRREKFGDRHPGTAESLYHLGGSFLRAGNLDKAHELLSEAVETGREVFQSNHRKLGLVVGRYGEVLLRLGRLDAAEARFLEALKLLDTKAATGNAIRDKLRAHLDEIDQIRLRTP